MKSAAFEAAEFVGLIFLGILAVTYGPLATIWMLNTLFGLTIPYTLQHWAAALLLNMTVMANKSSKK